MRAVQVESFGGASVLAVREIEAPETGPRDILVRVRASGINPIEWKIRSGAMARAIARDLPVTFGWACAGVVEAVGGDVTAFAVGDDVYSYPEFARGGTHAELVAIDEAQAARKPASLSFPQAAAAPMTAQAAWTLMQAAEVKASERLLVLGGGGAVGHWLIQLAAAAGAGVVVTASGDGLAAAIDLGASRVVDHRVERFEDVGRVDVVCDLVGGETQARAWAVLGVGGRLLSTATPPDARRAEAIGAAARFVFTPPSGADLAGIGVQIDTGVLKPLPVAQEFALADAARSHEMGEGGRSTGKLVLIP